jgi:hypothetical protein
MGVSTTGKGWGCWRSSDHRGKAPHRLIAALLGVSQAEAARIAGTAAKGLPDSPDAALKGLVARLKGESRQEAEAPLVLPPEYCQAWATKSAHLFNSYLKDRGFTDNQIWQLIENYDLGFAMRGEQRYRIIIPIYDEDEKLFTWSGRAINDDAKIRYKTLTSHADSAGSGPVARGPITDMLLGLPDLTGGRMLVLAEGPFDAMRLSLWTEEYEAHATCFFGKSVSTAQIDLIAGLRKRYDKIFLLLDPEASMDALGLNRSLEALGVRAWFLDGTADPGEMESHAIRQMLRAMKSI